MIRRLLSYEEIELCLPHGQAFYDLRRAKGSVKGSFDPLRFVEFWKGQYWGDSGVIVGAFEEGLQGAYGGIVVERPYDQVRIAMEHFWWYPNGGVRAVRLIRLFEQWAKEHGATAHVLAHFSDTPRIGQLYRTLGYQALETFYQKDL